MQRNTDGHVNRCHIKLVNILDLQECDSADCSEHSVCREFWGGGAYCVSYLSVISTSATMVEAVTGMVPMSDVNVHQNGLVLHA